MQLSSTEVDRILLVVDVLKKLSSQVLEHTESVRDRVNGVRWQLYSYMKEFEEEGHLVSSSPPYVQSSLQPDLLLELCPSSLCSDTVVNNTRTCLCCEEDYGLMVMCDSPTCYYKWFHIACVGLEEAPEGDWLCPLCAKRYQKENHLWQ